jgi:hypothetical protein
MDPIILAEVELSVGQEHLHGHVRRVLDLNPGVEESVRTSVTGAQAIAGTTRKTKGAGVTANSLNGALKREFCRRGGWSFEASVRDGVVFDSSSPEAKAEGFDLARYDEGWNLARLWSLCFGSRPVASGEAEWQKAKVRRPDLSERFVAIEEAGEPGLDLQVQPVASVIFGDIQFGNWGLGYRDMLRLIDADDQVRVDLYVYVTGSDKLNRLLSDGIVTFEQTVRILSQFPRLIRVPVWVLGLEADAS